MEKLNRSIVAPLIILATIGVFYVLVVGKAFLVPLAVALMVWYIINALSRTYTRFIPFLNEPNFWTTLASVFSIGLFMYFAIDMVRSNIGDVTAAAPGYKANLDVLTQKLVSKFGLEHTPSVNDVLGSIEIAPIINKLAGSFTDMISNVFLVLFYVLFMLLEQGTFPKKIRSLFPESKRRDSITSILGHAQSDIQTYIWIKTLTSASTGLVSYLVLLWVGVDFAGFWAFTIFLLNFIPTIGSIIATVFPALLALIQFDTFYQCFVVLAGVGAVQVVVGNFIEPRLMGNTLNLSPFVVMMSLTLWGSIWGIAGMFLSVPITVMLLIIFAHFHATRPIAVLLSGDGNLKFTEE
ncbi:MAG: AI-2E family transporter [Arenicella sp.]